MGPNGSGAFVEEGEPHVNDYHWAVDGPFGSGIEREGPVQGSLDAAKQRAEIELDRALEEWGRFSDHREKFVQEVIVPVPGRGPVRVIRPDTQGSSRVIELSVDAVMAIRQKGNPIDMDRVEELAEKMEQQGQRVPIEIAWWGRRPEVVDGHHRLFAADDLGWRTIKAAVDSSVTDETLRAIGAIYADPRTTFKYKKEKGKPLGGQFAKGGGRVDAAAKEAAEKAVEADEATEAGTPVSDHQDAVQAFLSGDSEDVPDLKEAASQVEAADKGQEEYAKAAKAGEEAMAPLAEEGAKQAQAIDVKLSDDEKAGVERVATQLSSLALETADNAQDQVVAAIGAALSQGAQSGKQAIKWAAGYLGELTEDAVTSLGEDESGRDIMLGAARMAAPVALVGGSVAVGLSMPWMAGFPSVASAIGATFLTAGVPVLATLATVRGDMAKTKLDDPHHQGNLDQWSNKALSQLSSRHQIVEGGKRMMEGVKNGWAAFRKKREARAVRKRRKVKRAESHAFAELVWHLIPGTDEWFVSPVPRGFRDIRVKPSGDDFVFVLLRQGGRGGSLRTGGETGAAPTAEEAMRVAEARVSFSEKLAIQVG